MSKGKGILLTVLLLLSCMGIGGTMAYLTAQTTQIVNTLEPGNVPPHILEEFDGAMKRNVRVKNEGNTDAFIRAAVVVSWKDENGNLAPQVPVLEEDYSIVWSQSGWKKLGAYYYCLTSVAPQNETPALIEAAYQKSTREGYDLVVDILSQTIQSRGMDSQGKAPVELAWNVIIANGEVRPAATGEGGNQ